MELKAKVGISGDWDGSLQERHDHSRTVQSCLWLLPYYKCVFLDFSDASGESLLQTQ